jgi:hypothetical protein
MGLHRGLDRGSTITAGLIAAGRPESLVQKGRAGSHLGGATYGWTSFRGQVNLPAA